MATEAQLIAARENGPKSSGPKSLEGKAISSQNARKHGLSARKFILEDEDQEKFDAVHTEYRDALSPANRVEEDLVRELAIYRFRLDRAIALAASSCDHETARQDEAVSAGIENPDADLLLSRALVERHRNGESEAFYRYENHFSRLFNRALRNLRVVQKDRRQLELAAATPAAGPPPSQAPAARQERLYSINEIIGSGDIPSLFPGAEKTPRELRQDFHIIRPQNEPDHQPDTRSGMGENRTAEPGHAAA